MKVISGTTFPSALLGVTEWNSVAGVGRQIFCRGEQRVVGWATEASAAALLLPERCAVAGGGEAFLPFRARVATKPSRAGARGELSVLKPSRAGEKPSRAAVRGGPLPAKPSRAEAKSSPRVAKPSGDGTKSSPPATKSSPLAAGGAPLGTRVFTFLAKNRGFWAQTAVSGRCPRRPHPAPPHENCLLGPEFLFRRSEYPLGQPGVSIGAGRPRLCAVFPSQT